MQGVFCTMQLLLSGEWYPGDKEVLWDEGTDPLSHAISLNVALFLESVRNCFGKLACLVVVI